MSWLILFIRKDKKEKHDKDKDRPKKNRDRSSEDEKERSRYNQSRASRPGYRQEPLPPHEPERWSGGRDRFSSGDHSKRDRFDYQRPASGNYHRDRDHLRTPSDKR